MQIFAKEAELAKKALTGDSFVNFVSRLGVGNGANTENTLTEGFYEFNLVTRNRIKLEAAYRGSWVVGKIVDSIADDMVKGGIDINTTEGKKEIKDVKAQMSKLKVWSSLGDNIRWGRLYGGSIGVIQIEGQDTSTPLRLESIGEGQFKGIVVYDRWQINPILNDIIPDGPDLGLPRMYEIVTSPLQVQPNAELINNSGIQSVHHSRVVRAIGNKLPFFQAITEMMWGESVLERLWDRMISFDNVTMSTASLVDRANLRTVSVDRFREVVAAGGDAYQGMLAFFEAMRELQVSMGLTVIDKEDVFQTTSYSFAGLSDVMIQFAQQLSGATDIPMVRLLGQSAQGLNATGESDMRIYYEGINTRQESDLRNPVDLVLRVLWRSVHGKAAPKDLEFTFTPLLQMTPTDKANNAKTTTETVIGAYESGLTKRSTSLEELRQSSGDTGIFANITDEDIAEADEELDPPPGETDPDENIPGSADPALKVLPGGKGIDPAAPNPKTDPATTPIKSLGGGAKSGDRRMTADGRKLSWWRAARQFLILTAVAISTFG